MKKVFYLIGFLLLFSPFIIQGALGSVIINEIAWMGTENSHNDEWIELYNNSSSDLELKGWRLVSEDGTPEVVLEGKIPSKGFFILERTDDTTLPEIKADLIYKGSLNNEGEHLKLINSEGRIVDEVDCSSEWFGGDNSTKQTMERIGDENWQTSQNPGGTPKAENKKQSAPPAGKVNEGQEKIEEKIEEKPSLTEDEKGLAAVSKTLPESSKNPLWIFIIASGTAIFSGIIIFLIKKKILKNKRV